MRKITREEQERLDDYSARGPRELAGMLIELERALDKKSAEIASLRAASRSMEPGGPAPKRLMDRFKLPFNPRESS